MINQEIQDRLETVLAEITSCTHCREHLPFAPKPVVRAHSNARILVIGQAPGTRVHESGTPWDDPSGVRLRQWLNVSKEDFYDTTKFAIVPMGFCYPGREERGGDKPPRPECAPMWHARLLECLPRVGLTLLIGNYAQRYYLGDRAKETLTETVQHWHDYAPKYFTLPHPSPRNNFWLNDNPWFEDDVVSTLQTHVHALLSR